MLFPRLHALHKVVRYYSDSALNSNATRLASMDTLVKSADDDFGFVTITET